MLYSNLPVRLSLSLAHLQQLLFASVTAALLLSGCASSGPSSANTPPDDFAVSLTVFTAIDPADPDQSTPAWFVVQPDGVLRAVVGVRNDATPLPPMVRQLSPVELAALYESVAAFEAVALSSGFERAAELPTLPSSQPFPQPPAQAANSQDPQTAFPTHSIAIASDRSRRSFMSTTPSPDALKPVETLLRQYAWFDREPR